MFSSLPLFETVKVDSGYLCYVSVTLGIVGVSSNMKHSCPRPSKLRCSSGFGMYFLKGKWCLGVPEAAGMHTSVSIDSGTDKTKPNMPRGSRRKPEPATTLTLILEGVVGICDVLHRLLCLNTGSLNGGFVWGRCRILRRWNLTEGTWMLGGGIGYRL